MPRGLDTGAVAALRWQDCSDALSSAIVQNHSQNDESHLNTGNRNALVAKPTLVALDLEGVLLEEVWLAIADHTSLKELRLTTRDVENYAKLMKMRIDILNQHGFTLQFLQDIIAETVRPLEGARGFLDWLKQRTPVVILSDIFMELVAPVQAQLGFPTIFGNTLVVDSMSGMVKDFHIRQTDGKRKAIEAFHELGFKTFAAGDSYNDLTMIRAAHSGSLFNAPARIRTDAADLRCCTEYAELQALITQDLLDAPENCRLGDANLVPRKWT